MKKILFFCFIISVLSCEKKIDFKIGKNTILSNVSAAENSQNPIIKKEKNTVRERFDAPKNYKWIDTKANSYGNFLENFPLQKYGSPIVKFNKEKIGNQDLHEAVFDIDFGEKDLQQCADAIIRLRAEYLFKTNKFEEIKFHFTSGDLCTWNDYKNGIRPKISGNNVRFSKSAIEDDSKQSFRNYLDLIFTYAGTISLFKETETIMNNGNLQTGDFIITPGSPGHMVFIAGVSKNKEGKKLYLLGEGFTPAQSISVMKNPYHAEISPWFELDVKAAEIKTSRYLFSPVVFKRY